MKKTFTIKATVRSDLGKGASRRLRRIDQVPGVVYGADKAPASIMIEHNHLLRLLENESFYTQILELDTADKKEYVLLRDLQRHHYKPRIMHIDLQRVSENEKVAVNIPLHFSGAELCPAVKLSGGLVSRLMQDVEVRCLPKDLPESIAIDLSKLEINQTIHLSDLVLNSGVEFVSLAHGEDKPVVTAYMLRAAEEAVSVAATPVAEKAKAEKKPEKKGRER